MNAPLDASESAAAGGTTRRYRPADRAAARALLNDDRAIDDPRHRIHVSADGAGLALWVHPGSGSVAHLGPVLTKTPNRRLFYRLIRACAVDALDAGFKKADFVITDPRLLTRIKRDFSGPPAVTVQVHGRNGRTQEPVSWRFEVDLAAVLPQLTAVTRG